MKIIKPLRRFVSLLGIVGVLYALGLRTAVAADPNPQLPAIIQNGFNLWTTKGVSYAFDVWRKGGLIEDSNKPSQLTGYFGRIDRTVGKYKGYELIESKRIGQTTQIVYVSVNFERAAIFARFLVYRTDKDWVIQDMDFSPRPEAIMPWLAFAGQDYSQ
jgi:hypothetical protein